MPYQIIDQTNINVPDVGIAMLTYNHGKFIQQTLDSIIIQETNYSYKIILADDFSTDETREILLNFQKKYPDRIKLILQDKNVGASNNNSDLHANLAGRYIAALEGDDYWTDPLKLQKQLDFLEANPDYSISFHSVNEQNDQNEILRQLPIQKLDSELTIKDLAKTNFIPTLSCVFRNYSIDYSKLKNLPIGDYPLHFLNASKGKIHFHKEVMGVYRTNVGIFSTAKKYIQRQKTIETLKAIINGFDLEDEVIEIVKNQKNNLVYLVFKEKQKDAKDELKKMFLGKGIYAQIPVLTRLKFILKFILGN